MSLQRIAAISGLTLKESARQKVAIGMIACSILMTLAFGVVAKVTQVTQGGDFMQVVAAEGLLRSVAVFTWVLAVFISLTAVQQEIERRTTYTLFAKPLERFEFVLGKFLGCSALLAINLAISAAIAYALISPENHPLAVDMALNLATYFVSRMALIALTVSLTLFLPMTVAGLVSLGIYFLASSFGLGKMVAEAERINPILRGLGQAVYLFGKYATPRVNWLNVDRPAIQVLGHSQAVAVVAVLAYCMAVLLLGAWAFSRREM